MTTTTQINITAKDSTAGAFASANNSLSGLASNALKTTAGLAGIGLSIAGAVDAIKGISQATIQFQQFTSTLQVGTGSAKGAADALSFVRAESQRLGLDLATAADQFAKLSAASRGTVLEGKATRDIFTSVAQAATVMGLSADQTGGALLAIQQIISKGTVSAEELRGQLGERLPGAFQIAARAIGVTTQELDKLLRTGSLTAEQLLPALSQELNKTFGSQAEQAAQGLTAQMNRMNTAIFDLKIAIGESGLINFLSSGIELATKLASALTSAFGGGQKLTAVEKQVSLIQTLEKELESLQNLTHIPLIGDLLFDKKQADLLKFRIEAATEDLGKMKAQIAAEAGSETVITQAATQAEKLSVSTKKTISDAERFMIALRKEADTVGLTTIEIKRLEAANLGISASADPLISKIEQVTNQMDAQKEAAKNLADDMRKIESITESVKTKEEKFLDTQTELNRLLSSGLSVETYNRALKKAQDETTGLTVATKTATDDVSQLWMQAGRNIQSTLANSIFNFFDDGLKGMLKNVIATVGRIASEFAALKIAQAVGLAGMFGAAGTAAASGGGSATGSALSLGSNALSLVKGGFGATSAISSIGSMLPGQAGAFFGGMGVTGTQAAAQAGASALWGTSGASAAASMGTSFAAMAGPAIALFAVDAIGRLFAGDKKLGGAEMIPVLGGFLAGLFGHGPMKFRQQSLQGDISSGGFDGDITNVFRAKGGLLVGNKHKSVSEQLPQEMQLLFDQTITGFYKSTHNFAENLGLDVSLVDNFTKEIQIKSEKGKKLTEEAINEMLSGLGNDLAKNLLPSIDTFKKVGEDSAAVLSRLSNEFSSITNAGRVLGLSLEDSRNIMLGTSFDIRTAFVDASGGIDSFNSQIASVAKNFLTPQRQLEIASESLNKQLTDLGVSTDITKDQFFELLQQTAQLGDAAKFSGLLKIQDDFSMVRDASKQASTEVQKFGEELVQIYLNGKKLREQAAAKERNEFTAGRRDIQLGRAALPTIATSVNGKIITEADIRQQQQAEIDKSQSAVQAIFQEQLSRLTEKFNATADTIKTRISEIGSGLGFFNGLKDSFLSIQNTSRESAFAQVAAATELAKAGADIKLIDTPELSNAISKLKDTTEDIFTSRQDFERAKAESASSIKALSDIGITKADETLDVLKDQLDIQQKTFALQEHQIKSVLAFSGGGKDLLNNDVLANQGSSSLSALIQNMAVQMGTTFLGSVRFPDPLQFQKLQNQIGAKLSGASTNTDLNLSGLLAEIKNLKDEIKGMKDATIGTNNLLNSVTRGGRAMTTTPA